MSFIVARDAKTLSFIARIIIPLSLVVVLLLFSGKRAQESTRLTRLQNKKIHGEFCKQWHQDGTSAGATLAWLVQGRFWSETEYLVMAIHDGVVHTKAFRKGSQW